MMMILIFFVSLNPSSWVNNPDIVFWATTLPLSPPWTFNWIDFIHENDDEQLAVWWAIVRASPVFPVPGRPSFWPNDTNDSNNWGMFSRKLYDLPNFLDLLVESLDNFVGAVRYLFRYHERDKWIHCVMDNFVWCVWIGSKCDKKDCLLSGEPMSKTIMRWMEYRTIFSVGFTVFPLGCTFTKTLVLPITFTTSPS